MDNTRKFRELSDSESAQIAAKQREKVIWSDTRMLKCPCGDVCFLEDMYRCLYCDVFYCLSCAQQHFGMTKEEWNAKNNDEI